QIQREHWYKELAPPWQGISGVIHFITDSREPIDALKYGWFELSFIVLGLVGTVVAALRFRPSWFVWMAGNWLLFTSTNFVISGSVCPFGTTTGCQPTSGRGNPLSPRLGGRFVALSTTHPQTA